MMRRVAWRGQTTRRRPRILPWTRVLTCALLAWIAGGCTLLQNTGEPVAIYDLQVRPGGHDTAGTEGSGEVLAPELGVAEFAAREPVSGFRMAVRDLDGAYGVIRGARWSLPPPRLLQAFLVERFAASGRFSGVGPRVAVRGTCELGGELGAFHWDANGKSVVVRVKARLQCGPDRHVVAMRSFEEEVLLQGGGAGSVAAAIEQAVNGLADALLEWTLVHTGPAGSR